MLPFFVRLYGTLGIMLGKAALLLTILDCGNAILNNGALDDDASNCDMVRLGSCITACLCLQVDRLAVGTSQNFAEVPID